MDLKDFYILADQNEPHSRLNADGIPLNPYKQRHLNHIVGQVRALREVYWKDPLIKEVTTNILAGLILVDGE